MERDLMKNLTTMDDEGPEAGVSFGQWLCILGACDN